MGACFAEKDQVEPRSNIDNLAESLKRTGLSASFYHFSGTGHWFFEPDRSQACNHAAANLA